ncbi:hypothetical protein BDF20DRAFT_910460 [Mycotypha africana]|uniref:uncharacterized protein n=1 Tax=Mycotypha africana TaxID=64632 RepID=UPI00230153E1|nr:uncharacterized protein BDF20DRAFT_910460 [Mycotypha africana]KAI8987921.1 hypothetical protein BDF20DRAFT_910460 [Mycotypha africana]
MGEQLLPYEILHCSSWDDNFGPDQLSKGSSNTSSMLATSNSAPTKLVGWQTARFPEYPQDLIIQILSGVSFVSKIQILSHQFKIATKVDIYIGLLKDGHDLLLQQTNGNSIGLTTESNHISDENDDEEDVDNMVIEFTRLGHIYFDNNAKAQFRARELKTIKINMKAEYIRLVIRNSHKNSLNTYNQVGMLNLDIIGTSIAQELQQEMVAAENSNTTQPNLMDNNSILSSSTRRTSISSSQSQCNARNMHTCSNIEREFQHWYTALSIAEEEAVKGECYQEAKLYKELNDKLETLRRILSDLEIGKRHAVETKDYDEAEKIKDDIKVMKQSFEGMLASANIHITEEGQVVHNVAIAKPKDAADQNDLLLSASSLAIVDNTGMVCESETATLLNKQQQQSSYINDLMPCSGDDCILPADIVERIGEEDRATYTLPIKVFGEDLVSCILSFKASTRLQGLSVIEALLNNDNFISKEKDNDDFIDATYMLIKEAILDSRESVITLTLRIWQQLLQQKKQQRSTLSDQVTSRAFMSLLNRYTSTVSATSDINSNSIIRQMIADFVITFVRFHPDYLAKVIKKPNRIVHSYREAKLRVELVKSIVMALGVSTPFDKTTMIGTNKNDGAQSSKKGLQLHKQMVPLKPLTDFFMAYLRHEHDVVKQAVLSLIVIVCSEVKAEAVAHTLDDSAKANLTEVLKKYEKEFSYRNSNAEKNIEMLSKKDREVLEELRSLTMPGGVKRLAVAKRKETTTVKKATPSVASTNKPSTTTVAKKSLVRKKTGTAVLKEEKKNKKVVQTEQPQQMQAEQDINNSNLCIFCEEINPKFNEESLIKHYYNECPALINCTLCQMITEISTLKEHMLLDCEKRHLVKECLRCWQAIPIDNWEHHANKNDCPVCDADKFYCPLCLMIIEPSNDAGWKDHLLIEGCSEVKKIKRGLK